MITAVDSNVLIDVILDNPGFVESSRAAMRRCANEGELVVCDVVVAEVAACFPSVGDAAGRLSAAGIRYVPSDLESALLAGADWKRYRSRGGRKGRVTSDFLVGAHAATHADRLLTRDAGFFRDYFKRLRVLDPTD